MNAAADGPIVRRAASSVWWDKNGDSQVDANELRDLFHGAIWRKGRPCAGWLSCIATNGGPHHPGRVHRLRELSRLTEAERKRIYEVAIKPYVFLADALAEHAGLP